MNVVHLFTEPSANPMGWVSARRWLDSRAVTDAVAVDMAHLGRHAPAEGGVIIIRVAS